AALYTSSLHDALPISESNIELPRLKRGLNAVLPEEISIQTAEEMQADFHPTLDAKGKEYRYFLCNTPVQSPIRRLYSGHRHQPRSEEHTSELQSRENI